MGEILVKIEFSRLGAILENVTTHLPDACYCFTKTVVSQKYRL